MNDGMAVYSRYLMQPMKMIWTGMAVYRVGTHIDKEDGGRSHDSRMCMITYTPWNKMGSDWGIPGERWPSKILGYINKLYFFAKTLDNVGQAKFPGQVWQDHGCVLIFSNLCGFQGSCHFTVNSKILGFVGFPRTTKLRI